MLESTQKGSEPITENHEIVGLFDIDGTITHGFAILSFAYFLRSNGLFDLKALEAMEQDFGVYKVSGKTHADYEHFAITLVNHYAQGLLGQRHSEVERAGEQFADKVLNGEIQDYTLVPEAVSLIQTIKAVGRPVAISGSPHESLWPLLNRLGFAELQGTQMEIEEGIYTGRPLLNLALDTNKDQAVTTILTTQVDRQRSFAFGDSLHDIPLLESVANGYVLGNNQQLHDLAKQKGWHIHPNGDGSVEAVAHRLKEQSI